MEPRRRLVPASIVLLTNGLLAPGRELQFGIDFIENGASYDGLRASRKFTLVGSIFHRKNECFWTLIYERADGFHQNIMRSPTVFILFLRDCSLVSFCHKVSLGTIQRRVAKGSFAVLVRIW